MAEASVETLIDRRRRSRYFEVRPMVALILNDDQVQAVKEASGRVPVCSRDGEDLGFMVVNRVHPGEKITITVEEAKELARRMSTEETRWYTTEEVLEHLRSLDAK
jgi:hypothetical protein